MPGWRVCLRLVQYNQSKHDYIISVCFFICLSLKVKKGKVQKEGEKEEQEIKSLQDQLAVLKELSVGSLAMHAVIVLGD